MQTRRCQAVDIAPHGQDDRIRPIPHSDSHQLLSRRGLLRLVPVRQLRLLPAPLRRGLPVLLDHAAHPTVSLRVAEHTPGRRWVTATVSETWDRPMSTDDRTRTAWCVRW
ncbi:hypothetical protein GCM10009610_46380 [Pseudonocardia xinjiangensis]